MSLSNRTTAMVVTGLFAMGASTIVAEAGIVIGDEIDLVYAGTEAVRQVNWTFDGSNGSSTAGLLAWSGGLTSFCVQLEENIAVAQTVTFDVVAPADLPDQPPLPGPMSGARSLVMQDLFARWYDDVTGRSGSDLKNHAAAFQMVIWEISHEMSADTTSAATVVGDLDLGTGDMSYDVAQNSGTIYGIAESMLDSLGGPSGDFMNDSRLVGLTNATYQDQLVVVPGPGAIAGLLGVAAIVRRRRRD